MSTRTSFSKTAHRELFLNLTGMLILVVAATTTMVIIRPHARADTHVQSSLVTDSPEKQDSASSTDLDFDTLLQTASDTNLPRNVRQNSVNILSTMELTKEQVLQLLSRDSELAKSTAISQQSHHPINHTPIWDIISQIASGNTTLSARAHQALLTYQYMQKHVWQEIN